MTAMTRVRARLRAESAPSDIRWNWSQLTTLSRLAAKGPITTTDLAQAEHVRRQSMAGTISALRAGGLADARPDPVDGRKILIHATTQGQALAANIPAAREAWLEEVIANTLDADEQQMLRKAAAILNRIADSDAQGGRSSARGKAGTA
jgi:DNA-binding MarR family transcriptional regulator